MVFGRRRRDEEVLQNVNENLSKLVKILEKMDERIERLEDRIGQIPERPVNTRSAIDNELEEYRKLNDKLKRAELARLKRSVQIILDRIKENEPEVESQVQEVASAIGINGGDVDIRSLLKNPILRIAINSFLRQFNTSIDDLERDPSKLIEILETITARLKQSQTQAQASGQQFDPFDPMLFFRNRQ